MSSVLIGFLSGLIAAVLTWHAAERQVRLRNVTEERAKWREKIREHAARLVSSSNPEVRGGAIMELKLRLNPYDELDREIAIILEGLEADETAGLEGLSLRLQLLLKHDWERAKREAAWWSGWVDLARRLLKLPLRPAKPDYAAFKAWRNRNAVIADLELPDG